MLLNAVFNSLKIMKTKSITELSDTGWKKYFELHQNLNRKYAPDFYLPDNSVQKFKEDKIKMHNDHHPFNHVENVIFDDELTKAVAFYSHTNYKETLGCGFDTDEDVISPVFMNFIMREIYQALLSIEGNVAARFWYFNNRRINALNMIGAEIVDKHILNRIYRKDMDINFYRSIIEKNKPNGEFIIKFYDKHPIELLSEFVKFINESHRAINALSHYKIPLKDQTEEEIRRYMNINDDNLHELIMFDKNDEIAGISEINVDNFGGKRLRQGLTGVAEKYRGRGFGKFLKASLYEKALEENFDFDFIQTDTMPWNKYMYRINEELGFKPYKEGFEFRLTKEFLENYLNVHEPVI